MSNGSKRSVQGPIVSEGPKNSRPPGFFASAHPEIYVGKTIRLPFNSCMTSDDKSLARKSNLAADSVVSLPNNLMNPPSDLAR